MKRSSSFGILSTACLLAMCFALFAQSDDKRLRYSARSFRGLQENGQNILELSGDVRFFQDSLEITSDKARRYPDAFRTEFWGEVRILEGSKWLQADRVVAYEKEKRNIATGNVRMGQGDNDLVAKKVTYYQDTDRALAEKDVILWMDNKEIKLTCGQLEYFPDTEYALATINPVITQMDSASGDSLTITGDTIEVFEGGERMVAKGQVEMTDQDGKATCGEAEYFRAENRMEMRQSPVAWQADQEMTADTITTYFEGGKISHSKLKGNATVTSVADSAGSGDFLNEVTGKDITLFFEKELLSKVVVEGTATSVYHVYEEGVQKGTNRLQGDRITFTLVDQELSRIVIESEPGVSTGRFLPPGTPLTGTAPAGSQSPDEGGGQ